MSDPAERPVGEVLAGLTLDSLPGDWTPIDVACMVKCLDADGKPKWAMRSSVGLSDEELLGALSVQVELLRHDVLEKWVADDD